MVTNLLNTAAPLVIGQILVTRDDKGWELRHRDDAECLEDDLNLHTDPEEAVALALYDDAGNYRPLKTAPNLRHGWRMALPDERAVRLALDLFYPGRVGAWQQFEEKRLRTTPLRETLGRQTGMYRVTGKITDGQADEMIGRFCRSDGGCLRTILWRRDTAGTVPSTRLPPEKFDPAYDQTGKGSGVNGQRMPLLCQEACNLLVAEARAVVKGKPKDGEE